MNLKEEPFTYFKNLDPKGEILAKPEGVNLHTHSIQVAQIANKIVENLYIHYKYKDYKDKFRELVVLTAYIHDAGKSDERWQEYVKNKGEKRPIISHSLFSLPIAKWFLEKYFKTQNQNATSFFINLALIAIATHHSPFNNEIHERYKDWAAKYSFKFNFNEKPYNLFNEARNEFISTNAVSPKDKRYFYVMLNGFLSFADWIASIPNAEYQNLDTKTLNEHLNTYFSQEGIIPYHYQEKAKCISGDILIQLPTGCGKTETSLFWLTGFNSNKVFYTLPTVTTVDAMRKRFEKIFGEKYVSFSHHLLEISLLEEERLTEADLFTQKHLLRPVAITTIDRILLSLMNYKRYTVNEAMLNNATLIIDEIHSYSPFTFSLIIEAIKYLKEYHNTKICIMSATLPSVIKTFCLTHMGNIKKQVSFLLDKEETNDMYKNKKRTYIKEFSEGKTIEENVFNLVKELIKKQNKILIVVNTVSKAQKIYTILKKLKDIKLILFHSRFTYGDRYKKLKEIEEIRKNKEKIVLVATQIVEVSLDIDFDVLITEVAPIDAIVQRAGRVNRKGKKEISSIYIFDVKDSENGYLPYGKKYIECARELLKNAKIESEIEYLKINEDFYEKLTPSFEQNISKQKLNEFLEQIYEKESIDKALATRDSFLTILVIPIRFKEKIEKIQKKLEDIKEKIRKVKDMKIQVKLKNEQLKFLAERAKYFVPITFYNVKDTLIEKEPVPFVDLTYNSTYGIKAKEDKIYII